MPKIIRELANTTFIYTAQLMGLATTSVQVNKAAYSAPYYSQLDGRWSGVRLGTGSFGATGCVPATMSMIISAVKDQTVPPIQVGNYLYYNTLEFNYSYLGTSSRGVVFAARNWGLKTQVLNSQLALAKALQEGCYVAAAVGPSQVSILWLVGMKLSSKATVMATTMFLILIILVIMVGPAYLISRMFKVRIPLI
ncbi:hypothetical protein K6V78_09405 [Streptococcus gallolyticus]|nr:hypothetical protein [Streptococcus gallolyticus]MBY5041715.1 hypothetical protein [Streptococcus gallolyticus]